MNRAQQRAEVKYFARKNTKGNFRFNPSGLTLAERSKQREERGQKKAFKFLRSIQTKRLVLAK